MKQSFLNGTIVACFILCVVILSWKFVTQRDGMLFILASLNMLNFLCYIVIRKDEK